MRELHALTFRPQGVTVRVPPGVSVLEGASWAGIAVDSTCGARGTCKKCRIQVLTGDLPVTETDIRAFSTAELEEGWRLACRSVLTEEPVGPLVLHVPALLSAPKAALLGRGRHVVLSPSVQKRHLVLPPATLDDQADDLERLGRELPDLELETPLSVLRSLPSVLRTASFDVTAVVVGNRLVAVTV